MSKPHRWSRWPSSYCLDCGAEDPMEQAMADGWLSVVGNELEFDTEEHSEAVREANVCLV